MKFKDSIMIKKQNEKEERAKECNTFRKRLIAYFIYFLLTHALACLFFISLFTYLSKVIISILVVIFYFNHAIFLLTSMANPGYVETNFVPVIDPNAYVYDESKKPDEESSVIESNYKLNMKPDSKRSQTQGNISRNQLQMLIKNSTQSYIQTIANQEDNHGINDNNLDTISIKKTNEIIVSPMPISNNNGQLIKENCDKDNDKENKKEKEKDKQEEQENNITTTNDNNTTSPNNPYSSEVYSIYCLECLIEIPLRAKHCTACNKCIATFDHHCTWLSNCIGERNKVFFIVFLLFHSIMLSFSFVLTLFYFKKETNLNQWLKCNWSLLLFDWLNVLFFSFVFSLLVFQLKILVVNQTSWENYTWHKLPYMRKLSGSQMSPFNYGLCLNISYVLCHKKYITKDRKQNKRLSASKDSTDNKKDYYKNIIDWKEIVNQHKRRRSQSKCV